MNRLTVLLLALTLVALAAFAAVLVRPGGGANHAHADHVNEPATPVEFVRFRINHYPDPPIYMASQMYGEDADRDLSPADDGIVPCDGTGPAHPRDVSLRLWTFIAIAEDQNAPSEHWDQSINVSFSGPGVSGQLAGQTWGHANINPHGRKARLNPNMEVWEQGWEASEGSLIVRHLNPQVNMITISVRVEGLVSGRVFSFSCKVPVADEVEVTS